MEQPAPSIDILERSRKLDERVAQSIQENLIEVFGSFCNINKLYYDELPDGTNLEADVVLLPVLSLLPRITEKIVKGKEKLLLADRIFPQHVLKSLRQIPPQQRVLIVSTSAETARDTQRLLYQMGVNWLYLDAYDPDVTNPSKYNIAITPGERSFVPSCIDQVVDIGYRKLDTQTFLSLFTRLNIDDERLTSRLLNYIQHLPPVNTDVNERYIVSFLINKTLQTVMDEDDRGVIIVDSKYRIIHTNKQVQNILRTSLKKGRPLTQLWNPVSKPSLTDPNFTQALLKVGNEPIMVRKSTMSSGKEIAGYYFCLETASSIHAADTNLSMHMKASGLYARYSFPDLLYRSKKMHECVENAKIVATTDYTVLITGDTGTGKELIAQSMHNYSKRNLGPFVAINCAALPETLLESELFGYERGAFTGSQKDGKIGLFEQANKGTIFLDEIGDMPLLLQLKLLRVLQERQIMRIGGNTIINIDVRVITATNRNLAQEVTEKRFREDLFYRINGFRIELPPLCERPEDIIYLFENWLGQDIVKLTGIDREYLIRHKWRGNVRELRNVVNYFKMMGKLPDLSYARKKPLLTINQTQIENMVLTQIGLADQVGIGRNKLALSLRNAGLSISEMRLEKILSGLRNQGLIIRHRGRKGCMLTEQGREFIKRSENYI